jgi:hypothetical protein
MSEQLHRAIGRIEGKLDGIAEALAARNARGWRAPGVSARTTKSDQPDLRRACESSVNRQPSAVRSKTQIRS